jgi:hypothetical protein
MISRRSYALFAFVLALLCVLAAPSAYAKIVAHGVNPIQAAAGAPVTSSLAYFETSREGTKPDEINVSIDWGDGTVTTGTVTQDEPNKFSIFGSHTYGGSGEFQVKIKIYDPIMGAGTTGRPTGD